MGITLKQLQEIRQINEEQYLFYKEKRNYNMAAKFKDEVTFIDGYIERHKNELVAE